MDRKQTASIALIVVLLACTIAIIAFVMSNGTTPIGPPTPVPGGGGLSSIIGEDDLTPVSTFTTLNAGTGLQGVGSGSRFTLNVITPTPQPTATPGAGGGAAALPVGLPVPSGSTPADTIYIGVPGVGFTSTGGGEFMVANDVYYEPYNVSESITVNALFFLVTSAGAAGNACRIGIYEADEDGQATNLVVDAGQVINDTTGWKSAIISEVLTPGKYLNAIVCNSGPALGDHASHSYISGAVSSGTTSSTRFVRKMRDSAPTGDPYTNGFANPGDSPFDTIDLGTGGSFVHFIMMRWSVN